MSRGLRPSRPRKGSAIVVVTPEREKRQAAVDSMTPESEPKGSAREGCETFSSHSDKNEWYPLEEDPPKGARRLEES